MVSPSLVRVTWMLPLHVFHAAFSPPFRFISLTAWMSSPPEVLASVATTPCQLSQTLQNPLMSPSAAATTSFCVTQQVPQTDNPSFPSILPLFATTSLPVTQATGIILSPALQPIPACLVRCIQTREFVEMHDLLSDNIALHNQPEAVHGPFLAASTPGSP